ncbi:MAG: hypothetical protein AAGB11_02910 [Pseudomonadota bacterium]
MTKTSSQDYATPFQIMMGAWTGHSILYDAKGKYLYTGPSLVAVYWMVPGEVMRYKQEDFGNLDSVVLDHEHGENLKDLIKLREFDLVIDGKSCKSADGEVGVTGAESSPGTYLFHLKFPWGDYYNNQFFENPNERRIIGPYVPKGGTAFSGVVSQTFSRISYDVPDALK